MKESSILKAITYILLPIILLVFIITSFYVIIFSKYNYESKRDYFNSVEFGFKVSDSIKGLSNNLIYAEEENYRNCYNDGENRIFVIKENIPYLFEIKNNYYLLIYENKVYTNLSVDNYNLLELRQTMENKIQSQKYVSLVKGDISSNSAYITNFLNQNENYLYCDYYYYTTKSQENEEGVYKSANIDDFEIYLTYDEDFIENSKISIILDNLNIVRPYKTVIYIVLPISFIFFMVMVVYLIISIGYTKNKEEININDFDKFPFEILLIVFLTCLGTCLAISEYSLYEVNIKDFLLIAMNFYLINIALTEIIFVTFVKRIKAKIFFETCIFGKIFIIIINIFKKIISKIRLFIYKIIEIIKNFFRIIRYNTNLSLKFGVIVTICLIVMVWLKIWLGPIGIVINAIIIELFVAWFLKRIQSFKRLEDALKNISEGKLNQKLEVSDYSSEFKNSIEYLNNISNGFESAVEESIKSERMKTELITNVSHDIKTPLTSIINYVDLLKKEDIDNEKAKEYLDILDSKSQRLKRLTEDLVEASKATSGNLKLDLKQINIVELINQAVGEFEDKLKENNLEIITKFDKSLINIEADSRYMYRVIENLFSNVSKYALDNSRVYIDVKTQNNNVLISIKNISKERLNITEEELMQRFVRGDKARTTEGSGLGLAIARSLVSLQGGKLDCKIDGDLFKIIITFKLI